MKVLVSFLLLLAIIGNDLNAQTKITVFTPSEQEEKKPKEEEKKPYVPTTKNMIKWNWSLIPRGVFMANFETYLSKKFTFEAGVGMTYRDLLFESIYSEKYHFLDFNFTKVKTGFAFEGGIKYYPRDFYDFEGIYLSPAISYRSYSFEAENYGVSINPQYSFIDIQAKFGYQYESIFDWDVLTDFYVGFALRNLRVRYYELSDNYFNSSPEWVSKSDNQQYPQAILGFKLSFPL